MARPDAGRARLAAAAVLATVATTGGCIEPPPVVVLDDKTALEQQAAGQYPELERKLQEGALDPGPETLTSGAIHGDEGDERSALARLSRVYRGIRAHEEAIDELLRRGCLGEGADGLLHVLSKHCPDDVEMDAVHRQAQRGNRQRRQLWEVMAEERDRSVQAVRDAWRQSHAEATVCGARIQEKTGAWRVKACD